MTEGVVEATETCASCGHAEAPGARFCGRCGARLVERLIGSNGAADEAPLLSAMQNCPSCGYEESRSAQFCSECGTPLPGPQVDDAEPEFAASAEFAPATVCTSCGGPVGEGERYCAACGATAATPTVENSAGVMSPAYTPLTEAEPQEADDSLASQSYFDGSAHQGDDSVHALLESPATFAEVEDTTGVIPPDSETLAGAEPQEIADSVAPPAGESQPETETAALVLGGSVTPPEAEGVAGPAPPTHQVLDDDSLSQQPEANGSRSKADDAIARAPGDSLTSEQPDGGAENSRVCPVCESRQSHSARFCGECGAPLAAEDVPDPSPKQAAEPQSVDSAVAARPASERKDPWPQSGKSSLAPTATSPTPSSAANFRDQPLPVEDGRLCPGCGSRQGIDARFCGECGGPLADEQSDVTAVVPPRAETHSEPNLLSTQRTSVVHAPAPPHSERRGRSRLWLLLVLVIALAGAGAAAAFILARPSHKAATPRTVTVRTPARTVTQAAASPGTTVAAPSSGAAPSPGSRDLLPSELRTEMTQEIQALLLQYHQDLVANDASSAWQLLSARKQHQELVKDGYAKWVTAQESLAPYLDPSGVQVRILAEDAASGVVTVDVTGMSWSAPGANCKEWSGITWAKYENGAWKYDPGYSTTAARKRAWKSRYGELLGAQC